LRPIDQRDIPLVRARQEVGFADDPAVQPQVQRARGLTRRMKPERARLKRWRMGIGEVQQSARPGRSELGDVVPPEIIRARLLDYVFTFTWVIDRETYRERLLVCRIALFRRVQFSGRIASLRTGVELRSRERQQVAE